MITFHPRALAHFAAIAIGLSAFAAAPAHALPGFGAVAHIASHGVSLTEGGQGSFSASKTYTSYNQLGDGVTGYAAAEMWDGKLHASSLATLGSCLGDGRCTDQADIGSTAAMWDTITFYQKENGAPVENISLLPLFINVDGHLNGAYAHAKFRYYLGYDANYSASDMPWIELGEGTYESLDSVFIPLGTAKMYVYFEIQTTALVNGLGNDLSLADFGNTLNFNWILPEDLAYTSESGTFLSGPISSVPEPASWVMMILGFGLVGLTLRAPRRRLCKSAERACTI